MFGAVVLKVVSCFSLTNLNTVSSSITNIIKNLHHLNLKIYQGKNQIIAKEQFFFICHIYPPFMRKLIVSLFFGRYLRTRLRVVISEESDPPVFHIKARAFR